MKMISDNITISGLLQSLYDYVDDIFSFIDVNIDDPDLYDIIDDDMLTRLYNILHSFKSDCINDN